LLKIQTQKSPKTGAFLHYHKIAQMTKRAKTNYPIHEILELRWSPRAFNGKQIETEKLQRLFEAARWSPSASNEQPWSFIIGQQGDVTFKKIFETLVEFNQLWVKTAPVVVLAVGRNNSPKNGAPSDWFKYDVGQSVAHLSFQATAEGLYVHQMAGFDRDQAKKLFNIPDGYEVITAFAIGEIGNPSDLHPNLEKMEYADRERKNLDAFVFSNTFGEKSDLI
jgi:nitroreductase